MIDPLDGTAGFVSGQAENLMFIQRLPATRTITRVTIGNIARGDGCTQDAVTRLYVQEEPSGDYGSGASDQIAFSPQVSIGGQLGKVTFVLPPTRLIAGRGYIFHLGVEPRPGCAAIKRQTWPHNASLVNAGPSRCAVGTVERRMWHVQGQDDRVPACHDDFLASQFHPSMPSGWLVSRAYRGDGPPGAHYIPTETWGDSEPHSYSCGLSPLGEYEKFGIEPVYWRPFGANSSEFVCRYKHYAPFGQTVADGWYYSGTPVEEVNSAPRDMYLKLELVPEDMAAIFRPNLYFDSSEQWRPLNVDGFFAETDHQLCGGPSGCVRVTNPDDIPRINGSYLDINGDGDGSNYKSPFEECNQLGRRDCDTGSRSAAYFRLVPAGEYNYLDYWFFYRFNDSPLVADELLTPDEDLLHEGDWESVTVGVPPDAQTFDFASFSQHGHWYSYLRSTLRCDKAGEGSCGTETTPSGRRVSVFVANRSHANYPRTCSATEAPIIGGQINCGQDRTDRDVPEGGGHDGSRQWGNNDEPSALLSFPAAPDRFEWQKWFGRWGASGDRGSSSSLSPARQEPHWTSPGSSDCPRRDAPSACSASSSTARTASDHQPDQCADWFGRHVAALLCDQDELESALRRGRLGNAGGASLDDPRDSVSEGSAPGLAQAVGPRLMPGDRLVVRGSISEDAVLLIRAGSSREAVTARFENLAQGPRDTSEIRIGRLRGGLQILSERNGLLIQPSSVDHHAVP